MKRQLKQLARLKEKYPHIWEMTEQALLGKGKALPSWPDWCFMPMAAWYAIISAHTGSRQLNMTAGLDVAEVAALGAWRYTQGIYEFDDDIYEALLTTKLNGDIPSTLLETLPEWCVYIKTPGFTWMGIECFGFYAHLESDSNDGRKELRFILDWVERGGEKGSLPIRLVMHLGDWSLLEAYQRFKQEAEKQSDMSILTDRLIGKMAEATEPLLSLLLYLCSQEPDIKTDEPSAYPQRILSSQKTKKGIRYFPPVKPRVWYVGREIGESIRTSRTMAGGKKSPHVRRAHWHGFWTGPRSGERKYLNKWLPPIFVNPDLREEEKDESN